MVLNEETKLYLAWLWVKLRMSGLFISVLLVNAALVESFIRSDVNLAYVGVIGNAVAYQIWKWRHLKSYRPEKERSANPGQNNGNRNNNGGQNNGNRNYPPRSGGYRTNQRQNAGSGSRNTQQSAGGWN